MPIALSGTGTIATHAPVGTVVGTLTATEPDGTPVDCVFYVSRPSPFAVMNGNQLVLIYSPLPAGAEEIPIATAPPPPAPSFGFVKVTANP